MTDPDAVLPDCDCCEGPAFLTPMPVANRPGRSALAYRVGTHASFKTTMLAQATGQQGLTALTSREDDDTSVALMDSWAAVLDVLSFYQERIANEGFLRTATETRSVYELASEIGYRPNPGVAASTSLAFELETAAGSPEVVNIPTGTKVQSLPGPGELPQTFETVEDLEARPGWNRLRPRMWQDMVPGYGDTKVWLQGVTTGLKPGDALLVVGEERLGNPTSQRWDFRLVDQVEADQQRGITRVSWERGLGHQLPGHLKVRPGHRGLRVYVLRQRASLFGHNAPDWRAMPDSIHNNYGSGRNWPGFSISGVARGAPHPDRTIFLDALYPKVLPGSWIVLVTRAYAGLFRPDLTLGTDAVAEDARTNFTMSAKTTRVTVEGPSLARFDHHLRDIVVYAQSEELALAPTPVTHPVQGARIRLASDLTGIQKGRTLLVVGPRPKVKVADHTPIVLTTGIGAVIVAEREVLTVVGPYGGDATTRTWRLRTAGGQDGTARTSLRPPQLIPVASSASDEVIVEEAVVDHIETDPSDPRTSVLYLAQPLQGSFDRFSMWIAANVAPATHGESRTDALGSSNGSEPFQAFTLRKGPLTYVRATTPTGGTTTLRTRVNDLPWAESPALFGLGPRDHSYVVQIRDDGTATLQFGDGKTGARLPTAPENLVATYRVGTGAVGNLKANQLSLLMTRPLGVRSVTNPLPASGGVDPESRDNARTNAPRTVLTFDRVVSLDDYAHFSRSYAGVAKAQASWVWSGWDRIAYVSVAGDRGDAVAAGSVVESGLAGAIRAVGDPHRGFRIASYEPLTFDVAAGVFLEPGSDWATVQAAVVAALREAFGFAARDLGQSVNGSEVIAAIQGVQGVAAVALVPGGFHLTGADPPPGPVLVALPGRSTPQGPRPAQLVTINPDAAGIDIGRRP